MINVTLYKPNNAYTTERSDGQSFAVSAGGYTYVPEQYIGNTSFEGDYSGWDFWTSGVVVDPPTNSVVIDYSEAADGQSSAFVIFDDNAEIFATDIYTVTGNSGDINNVEITFTIYTKTLGTGFRMFMDADFSSYVGDAYIAISPGTTWAKYTMTRTFTFTHDTTYILIGIQNTGTAGDSIIVDVANLVADGIDTAVKSGTYVTISPVWTRANPQQLVGRVMMFTNGNNERYGSIITEVTAAGNDISRIELREALPYAPVAGDDFLVFTPIDRYALTDGYSIGEYLVGGNITSSIDTGFDTASLEFAYDGFDRYVGGINPLNWRMYVTDDGGIIWDGYVSSYSVSDELVRMDCLGFKSLLTNVFYVGYFNSDAINTGPYMIRDMIGSADTLRYNIDGGIDRGNVINDAQEALNGIGPMDFTSNPVAASEAIDTVLKLGAYDGTFDTYVVQVWDELYVTTQRVETEPNAYESDWIIDAENLIESGEMSVELGQISNAVYGTYRGPNGETLETARAYDEDLVRRYGIRERAVSDGNLGEGEMLLTIETSLLNKLNAASISSISVAGSIRSGGASGHRAPWHMRAGDVVYAPSMVKLSQGYYGDDFILTCFVIGSISCDLKSGIASITPRGLPDKAEFVIAQLEVDTGG